MPRSESPDFHAVDGCHRAQTDQRDQNTGYMKGWGEPRIGTNEAMKLSHILACAPKNWSLSQDGDHSRCKFSR